MAGPGRDFLPEESRLKTYTNVWKQLCTFQNLYQAYQNAARNKSENPRVQEFEQDWRRNLCIILHELRTKTYHPRPARTFVLRDPKTRVITVSDFRDRVVHHALVNVLQPIFEPRFIHDSYASRKGKGTLPALQRFNFFKRKVSQNNTRSCFVLKADIRQYFQSVDHQILLRLIKKWVTDSDSNWLVATILNHYDEEGSGKGMPLGNWTSQFFANVYLNELDQYVKHTLKAKYYVRYVDDFVILHNSMEKLEDYQVEIDHFLGEKLYLQLHSTKTRIIPLTQGIPFLGFRIFYYHKLVRKSNLRKIKQLLAEALQGYHEGGVDAQQVWELFYGWSAYALHGSTYALRNRLQHYLELELTKGESQRDERTYCQQQSIDY